MFQTLLEKEGDTTILPEIVNKLVELLKTTNILFLSGDLGAGKTTLTQSLMAQMGVNQDITSPTFTIVNVYQTENKEDIYHFDLYRIKHLEELEEIGFYEYIYSGRPCIIEWPEIIEPNFQEPFLKLQIEHLDSGRRYRLLKND
ncbi:MAG: tRNA (adenosine(37)-N6)-threonylcarbamoyltransferase complex ATPase subunit type 1 TsaE [Bacteroidia bacterium]|nr:tRNA (adenosine(37)-N6)-threonylcarbamoyltransferase complex ATPase subunit type 1 TsaE [Bacteroidia bacterium]